METFALTVDAEILKKVLAKIIDRSQYFSVEPLPDCQYEVAVKVENKVLLEKIVAKLKK